MNLYSPGAASSKRTWFLTKHALITYSMRALIEIYIPAFEEFENLATLLPELTREINKIEKYRFRIFVILRLSEESDSVQMVSKLGAHVILRSPDNSFGSAISSGIRNLNKNSVYTIFMDADGSHSPKRIQDLISEIAISNADVVIASRYVEGGSSDNKNYLILMSRLLNFIYAKVLGIKSSDSSTNFKIYKTSNLLNLDLRAKNYDIIQEILLKLRINKEDLKIVEIPDHFGERRLGKSKRKLSIFILTYIFTLMRLRVKLTYENFGNRK